MAAEVENTYYEGGAEDVYWHGRDRNVKFFSDVVTWSTRNASPANPGGRVTAAVDSDDESEAQQDGSKENTAEEAATGPLQTLPSRDDSTSGELAPIRAMLEEWEEPPNRNNRVSVVNLSSVLIVCLSIGFLTWSIYLSMNGKVSECIHPRHSQISTSSDIHGRTLSFRGSLRFGKNKR